MTPEEIIKAEVDESLPAAAAAVNGQGDETGINFRGKTNDSLRAYQGPGFGRGSTHRHDGINAGLSDSLFNAVDPDKFIKTEKAWHRRAVDLSIQGFTVVEICNLLGYGRGQVETVLKQPWAQERIIEASKKNVLEEMRTFLEGEVMPSLVLIKQFRDDETLEAKVRSEQASKLLNRFLGKEVQPMISTAKDEAQMSSSELAAEAARILEQQRQ